MSFNQINAVLENDAITGLYQAESALEKLAANADLATDRGRMLCVANFMIRRCREDMEAEFASCPAFLRKIAEEAAREGDSVAAKVFSRKAEIAQELLSKAATSFPSSQTLRQSLPGDGAA